MKIGLTFFPTRPQFMVPMAKRADELGFESIWVPEHLVFPTKVTSQYPYNPEAGPPLPTTPLFDPLIALTYVAAVTSRVQLGTGVYILPLRHPIITARAVASLDVLSQGRVLLGIGVGWLKEELEAVDSDFENRGPRTDEIVEVMRRLWTEPTVAHDGKFYSFPEVGFEPKPVRSPVPILVGGETGPALRRAARIGDGWFGMGHTPDKVRDRVRHLQSLREDAGRGGEPLEITVQCAVPPTVENFRKYEDAGVDRVTLSARSFATKGRTVESSVAGLEEFAGEVLSKL